MESVKKSTHVSWRRFLITPEGIEGMLYLRERTPNIVKGDANEIIFGAGVVEGYRRALDTLSEIIAAETKPEDRADND